MSDDPLDARWQELMRLTEQEFFEHSQHPGGGVFDPQRQQLKLRGILKDGSYFSLTLTPQQVLDSDLAAIAREFYTAYRAARSAL